MAKPPADIVVDKATTKFGDRAYSDDRVFRIDAAPFPWSTLICTNLLFVAAGYGFHLALKHLSLSPGGPSAFVVYVAPFGPMLVACLGFTAAICWSCGGAPWLIYDKATGHVELPRQGLSFTRREVVRLDYIATKLLHPVHQNTRTQSWALYLVTSRVGEQSRWPLARSLFANGPLDYIVLPLTQETDLPVVWTHEIKDERQNSSTVTQMPYFSKASPAGGPEAPTADAGESSAPFDLSFAGLPPKTASSDDPLDPSFASAGIDSSPSAKPLDAKPSRAVAALNKLGLVQLGLFLTAWTGICLYFSVATFVGGVKYDRKMAIIERGEAKPYTIHVVGLRRIYPGKHEAGYNWEVRLREDGKDETLLRKAVDVDGLHIGSPVKAYCFDDGYTAPGAPCDGYMIPRFDRFSWWSECFILAFALLPASVAIGIFLYKRPPRAKSRADSPAWSH